MQFRRLAFALAVSATLPSLALAQAPAPSTAPSTAASQSPEARDAARDQILEDAIPLTPDMIRELARRYGESERAREEGVTPLASPVSRPLNVTFAPGQATGIVQTVRGYPTALSFFDSTGSPGPLPGTPTATRRTCRREAPLAAPATARRRRTHPDQRGRAQTPPAFMSACPCRDPTRSRLRRCR